MIKQLLLSLTLSFLALNIQAQVITNYTETDGLASNNVNCLTVAGDSILFGTDKGISLFDGTSWQTFNVADGTGLIDDVITAIHLTDDDELWVGTDYGISRWDGNAFVNYTEADGIGNNRIQAIDSYDDVMSFGNKNGFALYNTSVDIWQTFDTTDGLPFGGVTDLFFQIMIYYYLVTL